MVESQVEGPIEKGMQTSRFIFKEENEYGYVNPGMNAPTMLIHWPSGKTHALPSPNASLVHSLSDQGLLLFTEHLAPIDRDSWLPVLTTLLKQSQIML